MGEFTSPHTLGRKFHKPEVKKKVAEWWRKDWEAPPKKKKNLLRNLSWSEIGGLYKPKQAPTSCHSLS
jgi:hypothetical protein